MNHEELLRYFRQAENQLVDLSATLATLRSQLEEVIEENNQLRMANQDLHALLVTQEDAPSPAPAPTAKDVSRGRGHERLQAYYDEGIHICHAFFGAPRQGEEECILCLGVLDEMGKPTKE